MDVLPTLIAIAGLAVLIGASTALLGGRPMPVPVRRRMRARR